jgi:hypothetical protein
VPSVVSSEQVVGVVGLVVVPITRLYIDLLE